MSKKKNAAFETPEEKKEEIPAEELPADVLRAAEADRTIMTGTADRIPQTILTICFQSSWLPAMKKSPALRKTTVAAARAATETTAQDSGDMAGLLITYSILQ